MQQMKRNCFQKSAAFERGVIDWVRAFPNTPNGEVREEFYRAELIGSEWKGRIPRLLLRKIERYNPTSKRWLKVNRSSINEELDFQALRKSGVPFASKICQDGSTLFLILYSTTGRIRNWLPTPCRTYSFLVDECNK